MFLNGNFCDRHFISHDCMNYYGPMTAYKHVWSLPSLWIKTGFLNILVHASCTAHTSVRVCTCSFTACTVSLLPRPLWLPGFPRSLLHQPAFTNSKTVRCFFWRITSCCCCGLFCLFVVLFACGVLVCLVWFCFACLFQWNFKWWINGSRW